MSKKSKQKLAQKNTIQYDSDEEIEKFLKINKIITCNMIGEGDGKIQNGYIPDDSMVGSVFVICVANAL